VSKSLSNAKPDFEESEISMQEFLEAVAPNEARAISGLAIVSKGSYVFATPDLTLFCPDDICGRPQTFTCTDTYETPVSKPATRCFTTGAEIVAAP
jgi:hypothetical protein